ncbi:MAG: hypothetical protein COT00_03345 [Candidatus Omnitrophica bacterium CG07_land_8_20_14_0_80_50_8]|nr:MAG: hypothetical protein COT00_03345 [Candidatus Omnitrophica bacterium CG07_land_8_20_14_0_80_50_8]
MREISIQTKTFDNYKRKNLSIIEVINQEGFLARAEKKYAYYVSEQNEAKDSAQLKAWVDSQAQAYQKKARHVSIQKTFDHKTGFGQMIYRVIGSFYVVQNLRVFAVVFMHSIKFDMLSHCLPGQKL